MRGMKTKQIFLALVFTILMAPVQLLAIGDGETEVTAHDHPPKVILEDFESYSKDLYRSLGDADLDFKAFDTALKGFVKLQLEDQIENTSYLTVIDMSRSANDHRFFLINLKKRKIELKTVVAHGRNSGGEYARVFSNKEGSFKTSLGFYKTAETYHGKHGLSLRLDGLEASNDNARDRAIVIHAADYVSRKFIETYGRLGRSLGCPSLPHEDFNKVVHKIKNGTLLFVYYPEKTYFSTSEIANHDFNGEVNG
jgi:hypothetical protein